MKKLVGVFATIALLGSGAAFAGDDKNKPQQDPSSAQGGAGEAGSTSTQSDPAMGGSGSTQSDPAMGGSGSSMSGQATAGQKELTGKVVKADSKMVYVDHMGAVVPLSVDKSTTFGDPNVKRAKDLQPGMEIRASYEVQETKNVAKSISMSGTGGSGDVMSPDSSINEGQGTGLEEDKGLDTGTGGSGSMDDHGTGGSGDTGTMNPDTSSNPSP
ncbi:RNA-binding protein [Pyxidicoccus fallax]|uniref:RNA-binding protein n=1 Tax=Pyxidicoccus fallax TaxID=394095 RepID=A0A848L7M3_9BACT|nr:RNA-binding protein [Pyxidicoccus fallax]NMO14990.1 RNA-binding protein [Pyxidicoccus fallax]NPC81639.1 RNA-binding protein [Pyxidicoccus fallax]